MPKLVASVVVAGPSSAAEAKGVSLSAGDVAHFNEQASLSAGDSRETNTLTTEEAEEAIGDVDLDGGITISRSATEMLPSTSGQIGL